MPLAVDICILVRCFGGQHSVGICQVLFSRLGRNCGCGGGKPELWRVIYHMLSKVHTINSTCYCRGALDPWAAAVFVKFLHYAVAPSTTLGLWGSAGWGVHRVLLPRGFVYCSSVMYLGTHLYQHGPMGVCFMLWVTIHITLLIFHSIYSRLSHRELFPLAPAPHWPSPVMRTFVGLSEILLSFQRCSVPQVIFFVSATALEAAISPRSPGSF